jgi:16S rRNA (cytosine967-C5)-methyltransferase
MSNVPREPPPRPAPDGRVSAAESLLAWLTTHQPPERDPRLRERGFTREAVLGVVRNRGLLDLWIQRCAAREPTPALRAVLWVGLYELLFMRNPAEHAIVHSAVDQARRRAGPGGAGFVNALLRRAQREGADWLREAEAAEPWVRWSHPEWLGRRWLTRYGLKDTAALCRWDNEPAPVCIRICAHRIASAALLQRWRAEGIEAVPHPADPEHFALLPGGVVPHQMAGFDEGWWYVQDPSTDLAPRLLAPRAGERILDACAAPGGKTIRMAEHMLGRGTLVAADPAPARVRQLTENLQRMRQPWVTVQSLDARKLPSSEAWMDFDAILLDVPCSNTGVLRRRPAARWRLDARELAQVCGLQRSLLEAVAPRLRPGGRLVYSTCSLEPEENEEQARAFLSRHPDFEPDGEARAFPPRDGCDGAYAVRLKKGSLRT